MSKRIMRMFVIPLSALLLIFTITSCKQKANDTDVKTRVTTSIAANPALSGINVNVDNGIATLTGEVKDEATKASAEKLVEGVSGVKSVVNNLTIAATPPPVQITADDPLKASVDNTLKAYPGVTATINDGVVTLTGEIKRADLQQLMIALNALKPKKIENKLTIK